MAAIKERIKVRLPGEDESVLDEFQQTIEDRLCLRLNVDKVPSKFESIVVDAVVKMFRRVYYEGVASEGADSISTSFVDDILSEYDDEIASYLSNGSKKAKIKFL